MRTIHTSYIIQNVVSIELQFGRWNQIVVTIIAGQSEWTMIHVKLEKVK